MITQNSNKLNAPDNIRSRVVQLQNGLAVARGLGPPVAPPFFQQGIVPAPPPRLLRIYLAPEYFFRKHHKRSESSGKLTAYTEEDKNYATNAMQHLSRQAGGCLVIGGSVFWTPPVLGNFKPIRHTLFVFYDGQLLLEYDKRNDCGELWDFELSKGYRFMPGSRMGTFVVEGLNCGLETCVDHELGQLKNDAVRNLDLQIVISNTVTIRPSNIVAKRQGYVLHCNAIVGGASIYRYPFDAGTCILDQPLRWADLNSSNAFFDLPWPANG
jgi:predicted amidohydrolase